MKKTQFKLILNSNSYRIYTDNGIEYCRFKKKYYPLNEIENVINSYKIGGGGASNPSSQKQQQQQQPSNPQLLDVSNTTLFFVIIAIIELIPNERITTNNLISKLDIILKEPNISYTILVEVIKLIIKYKNISKNIYNLPINYTELITHLKETEIISGSDNNSPKALKIFLEKTITRINKDNNTFINAKTSFKLNKLPTVYTTTFSKFIIKIKNFFINNINPTFDHLYIIDKEDDSKNKFHPSLEKIKLALSETVSTYNLIDEIDEIDENKKFFSHIDCIENYLQKGTQEVTIENIKRLLKEPKKELNTIIIEKLEEIKTKGISKYTIIINNLHRLKQRFRTLQSAVEEHIIQTRVNLNEFTPIIKKLQKQIKEHTILNVKYTNSLSSDPKLNLDQLKPKQLEIETKQKYNDIKEQVKNLSTTITNLATNPFKIGVNLNDFTELNTEIKKLVSYSTDTSIILTTTHLDPLNTIITKLDKGPSKDEYMLLLGNAFFFNFNKALYPIIYLTRFPVEDFMTQKLEATPSSATLIQKEPLPPQIIEATGPVLKITQDLEAVEAAERKAAEEAAAKKEAVKREAAKREAEAAAKREAEAAAEREAEAATAKKEADERAAVEAAAAKRAEEERTAAIAKQKLEATSPSGSLTQKEILPPQIIKATSPSGSLTQKEILPPQIIEATSPSGSLTQKEILPPQIIEATSPSGSLTQKEILPQLNETTDKPQIIEATSPSASLTQKEPLPPQKESGEIKNELSITESIELAEKIIKLLKKQEIPTIYAYYLYFNRSKDTKDTQEIIKKIKKEILKDPSKYKTKYENICDAVNRLMLYLTATAKKIKVDNYTDETLCDEYNIYFKSLVFTPKILNGIEKDASLKQKLTEKYIKALNKELPTLFENIKDKTNFKKLLGITGGDNNYKTAIDNIFNYTESSDESDMLYDSDISEESIISIRSDYSEDLITPLLTPQT
jgi:hypothetical protein